jgi:AcrR family transcriptional regulator
MPATVTEESMIERAFAEAFSKPDEVDETSARVLDAAYEQFCRKGIRPSTMEDVARRAGVSRIAVYRRFSTKDELVEQLVRREYRRYFDQFVIDIQDAKVKTSAYRVVVSKSLTVLGIAAGIGQDRYSESAQVRATSGAATSTVVSFEENLNRTNYFLDLSLNLPIFKLIGEVGQVTGGTVETYNEFTSGRADKSRTYGSLGFRLAF